MNPERLLGDLVGSFLGGGSTGPGTKKAAGKGSRAVLNKIKAGLRSKEGILLGLGAAFGTYEAYQATRSNEEEQSRGSAPAAAPPPLPPPGNGVPPPVPQPPPIPDVPSASQAPPVSREATLPSPLPQKVPELAARSTNMDPRELSIRLIQAMIAAAYADGEFDEKERERIIGRLEGSESLGPEERDFLAKEMEAPRSIEEIVAGVEDHGAKRMMYGLSVAAIETDTFEEFSHLQELGRALGLCQSELNELHNQFGNGKD